MAEVETVDGAPADPGISFVRLVDVKPEFKKLLDPNTMYVAKSSCKKCYGRGYKGFAKIVEVLDSEGHVIKDFRGIEKKRVEGHQWCECVMVNMNVLADRMTRAREAWLLEHPEDQLRVGLTPSPPKPGELHGTDPR